MTQWSCNHSTWEEEAKSHIQDHPWLHSQFKRNIGYHLKKRYIIYSLQHISYPMYVCACTSDSIQESMNTKYLLYNRGLPRPKHFSFCCTTKVYHNPHIVHLCVHVYTYPSGGQLTTCRAWFSLSTRWSPGINSDLAAKLLYTPSHLILLTSLGDKVSVPHAGLWSGWPWTSILRPSCPQCWDYTCGPPLPVI